MGALGSAENIRKWIVYVQAFYPRGWHRCNRSELTFIWMRKTILEWIIMAVGAFFVLIICFLQAMDNFAEGGGGGGPTKLTTERIGVDGKEDVERKLTTRIADNHSTENPMLIEGKFIRLPGFPEEVHYLEGGAQYDKTILFLHGAAFSAKTWQEIEVLDFLLEKGFHVIAIDLPGYGELLSGKQKQSQEERNKVVEEFVQEMGIKSNILVIAASMGGTYAWPFVAKHPNSVAGFVTISALVEPASARKVAEEGQKFPLLMIWGENDHPGSSKAKTYQDVFPHHDFVIFPNAGHPCYLDDPKFFKKLVYIFADCPDEKDPLTMCATWDPSNQRGWEGLT